jgi:glycopeptide antibiotics resistance protein
MNDFYTQIYLFFNGIYIDIVGLVKNADPILVIACFIICVAAVYLSDRFLFKKGSVLFALVFGAYLTFVLSVTILGRKPELLTNWNGLFHTYTEAFSGNAGLQLDILFNIFLYVPVGMLLSRYRNDYINIGIILTMTVVIELAQLITSLGVFEISDVINNFIGGLIGLGVARMTLMLYHTIKENRKGGRVERAE